jgi:hypothetical protein
MGSKQFFCERSKRSFALAAGSARIGFAGMALALSFAADAEVAAR